jgi:hypothetical protein
MTFSLKTANAKFTLSIILLSFATCASAGPKEDGNRHECPTSSSRGSPAIQPGMS